MLLTLLLLACFAPEPRDTIPPDEAVVPPAPAVDAPAAPAPVGRWPVRKVDDTRYVVDFTRLSAIPQDEWLEGRAIPHRDAQGDVDGMRLTGISADSLGAALGLRNGDVVNRIDGQLAGADAAIDVLAKMRRGQRMEMAVTRRGEPLTIVLEPGTL